MDTNLDFWTDLAPMNTENIRKRPKKRPNLDLHVIPVSDAGWQLCPGDGPAPCARHRCHSGSEHGLSLRQTAGHGAEVPGLGMAVERLRLEEVKVL